jgi:hypothetical protein
LKRNKVLHEDIQELEDWIMDKEREAPADDGPVFYQEQLRERLEQYQVKNKRKSYLYLSSFLETSN